MNQKYSVLSQVEALQKITAGETIHGCVLEELDLSGKEFSLPVSLEECSIGSLKLIDSVFKATVVFSKTIFTEEVLGGWQSTFHKTGIAVFQESVSFKECDFQCKVLFGGAKFQSLAAFQNAIFHKNVFFINASFQEQVYFWKASFYDTVSFQNCTFGIEGHFDQCEFFHTASFESAKFLQKEGSFNSIHAHENLNFLGASFEGYLAFRKAIVDGECDFKGSIFSQEADFSDARFLKKTSFRNAIFQKKAIFLHTVFEGLASFLGTRFQDANFLNAQFQDEMLMNYDRNTRASMNEAGCAALFEGCADFTNARFHKRSVFEEVAFSQSATFANAYFGEQADFIDVCFHGPVSFNSVYCNQELSAVHASFKEVTFDYANINRRLDLSEAKIDSISFYKAALDLIVIESYQVKRKLLNEHPNHLEYNRVKEEYLILKESFQKRGLTEEEDWAYWKFRQMKRKDSSQRALAILSGKNKEGNRLGAFFKLLWNFFERISIDRGSGYGTKPLHITLVAFSVILLFAYIYSTFSQEFLIQQKSPFGFAQAVYFSFATFTTMGVGDIQPILDSFMTYIVSTEAFLGLFIMTLFVGTYTRKIIR